MLFDPTLAEIRFGTGLSPLVPAPQSVSQMLSWVQGPDRAAAEFPIESFDTFRLRMVEAQRTGKAYRRNKNAPNAEELRKTFNKVKQAARQQQANWLMQTLARRSHTQDGFRERLAAFWADHFTVIGKGGVMKRVAMPVAETFLRPHLAGRFSDLLVAAVTNPGMVNYLDQQYSVGPNAPARAKMPKNRGLNENLAREILELHTLGVGGPYGQKDVRQLAELLTGLGIDADGGMTFRPKWAEPGSETVLGQTYGGETAALADIHAALQDLAAHPATAQHICSKLAVHFLGDAPDPGVIRAMKATWIDSGGQLLPVYRAMLHHPSAWQPERVNVKLPFDFMSSVMRALAVRPDPFRGAANDVEQRVKKFFLQPLRRMGQPWERPQGPDGWPEEDETWVTPQGLATRLEWALFAPPRLQKTLPDPRQFVQAALGAEAPEPVRFAAQAAENRAEGIALVLISPAFQRR
ncbi:DUF1800 domain-containing protein [Thalassobius sp. S69A]|uniref:DUF1800 domain-containing protein n=1 Tax=unclassified Thalassovita TaxID=2619711 RepID=UPI000C11DEA8|nr:hypothetical protein [Paracoccaceae bacterium]MBT24960.1 hypothetical protein [Paracoccaceae bacterium]